MLRPHKRPRSKAPGAKKKAGGTVITTSGLHLSWARSGPREGATTNSHATEMLKIKAIAITTTNAPRGEVGRRCNHTNFMTSR